MDVSDTLEKRSGPIYWCVIAGHHQQQPSSAAGPHRLHDAMATTASLEQNTSVPDLYAGGVEKEWEI